MKWIVIAINLAAVCVFVGLRQYAHGYHNVDVEDAYQGLISRALLDDAEAAEYAQAHNGWHPKERLRSIGHPDGFVQVLFVGGVAVCLINSAAVLLLTRKRSIHLGS